MGTVTDKKTEVTTLMHFDYIMTSEFIYVSEVTFSRCRESAKQKLHNMLFHDIL